MWPAKNRGCLQIEGKKMTVEELAGIVAKPVDIVKKCVKELEERGVFSRFKDGTIYNRKMYRESAQDKKIKFSQKKGAFISNMLRGHSVSLHDALDLGIPIELLDAIGVDIKETQQELFKKPNEELEENNKGEVGTATDKKGKTTICPRINAQQILSPPPSLTPNKQVQSNVAPNKVGTRLDNAVINAIGDILAERAKDGNLTLKIYAEHKGHHRYADAIAIAFPFSIASSKNNYILATEKFWKEIELISLEDKADIIRICYWKVTGKRGRRYRNIKYLATHTTKKPWLKIYTFKQIIESIELYFTQNKGQISRGYSFDPNNFFSINTPEFMDYLQNKEKKRALIADKKVKNLQKTEQFRKYKGHDEKY